MVLNVGFSSPYQHSLVSAYTLSDKPADGVQQKNTGSVLKSIEETKATATIQTRPQTALVPEASEADIADEGRPEQTSQQEIKLQSQQAQEKSEQELESRQLQQDQKQIQQLSARDREVRNHERAHAAVGGQYAGAPRYQYERGPDGVNYAVSGEVAINMGAINGDPQATIEKAEIVRRAALAPAEPSPQDRRVASQAMQMEMKARADLAELQRQERLERAESTEDGEEVKEEPIIAEEEKPVSDNPDKEPMFDLFEQRNNFNRLSAELSRSIIGSDIESQAPRPGQVVSRFA